MLAVLAAFVGGYVAQGSAALVGGYVVQGSAIRSCLTTQTINCGHKTCCAIGLPRNHLSCWGSNGIYQISNKPKEGVMAVSCSKWACCAVVKNTMGVKCWGGNVFSELDSPKASLPLALLCCRTSRWTC